MSAHAAPSSEPPSPALTSSEPTPVDVPPSPAPAAFGGEWRSTTEAEPADDLAARWGQASVVADDISEPVVQAPSRTSSSDLDDLLNRLRNDASSRPTTGTFDTTSGDRAGTGGSDVGELDVGGLGLDGLDVGDDSDFGIEAPTTIDLITPVDIPDRDAPAPHTTPSDLDDLLGASGDDPDDAQRPEPLTSAPISQLDRDANEGDTENRGAQGEALHNASPDATLDRTTSTDLDDLLSKLGDDANSFSATGLTDAPPADERDLERPDDRNAVVIESTRAIDFRPDFASYPKRAASWAIDTVVTNLALAPGAALAIMYGGGLRLLGILIAIVGFALVALSYTDGIAKRGQWIGNRVTSTKVVQATGGGLLGRSYAFSRFFTRALMSPFLLLGFAVALTNTSRRTFHDHVAGSIVTGPDRASWSIDDEGA